MSNDNELIPNESDSNNPSMSHVASTQSDNPAKETGNMNKFLPRKKREKAFIEKVSKIKDAIKGLRINVRATDGDIRIITSADDRLIAAGVVFPAIEAELEPGEYAVAISYKLRHNDEHKLIKHLEDMFGYNMYLHRNQDESKVTVTFVRSNDGDWRTQFNKFFTIESPTGYKRAKNLWQTSSVYREYDHVRLFAKGEKMLPKASNTLDIFMFTGGFLEHYDGYFIVNSHALKGFHNYDGSVNYDTARISLAGLHIKGDAIVMNLGPDAPDVLVHEENIKRGEFGFKPGLDGALVMLNPKKQYKTARTSPQHDSAFGWLMEQQHRELTDYTYYEVAAQEALGHKLAQTILGHNTWIGMALADGEDSSLQAAEYANVAEMVMDTMGSIIGVPHLVLKSVEMAKRQINRHGKQIKVEIPGARMVSMRSTWPLELADLPVPTGNTISLSKWGSHIPDEILTDVLESTGGSDFDDTWTLILVELTDDHTFRGHEFTKGETAALLYRYPMGQRVHEGKVGVEYWLAHIADDRITREYVRKINPKHNRKVMLLDPSMLPTHVLDLPAPEVTEPTTGELGFMEQVEQSMELAGLYDRVANGLGLLTHLASLNNWELHSDFTLPFSAEFLIDVCTKTFGGDDLRDIETLTEAINNVIHDELHNQPMDENGRPMVGAEFLRRLQFKNTKNTYNEVTTWLFDKQAAAYGRTAQRVEVQLDIFARSYKNAWAALAPEGNLHSANATPSKISTALINKLKEIQGQFVQSGRMTPQDYLISFTRTAEVVKDKLEFKHIEELFTMQGNPTAWSNGTNLIGHVLFNGVMADKTIAAITAMKRDWMRELLEQGIYNQVLKTLETTPRDQEIVRVFLRTIWGKVHVPTLDQSHTSYVVDRFSNEVDEQLEALENVVHTVTEDAVAEMSISDIADQLADEAGSEIWG